MAVGTKEDTVLILVLVLQARLAVANSGGLQIPPTQISNKSQSYLQILFTLQLIQTATDRLSNVKQVKILKPKAHGHC